VDDLLSIAASNAVAATVLAVAAIAVGAVYRRPALVHGLWLLVLLKLVTPPLVFIPVAWPTIAEAPAEIAVVGEETMIESSGGSRFARPTLQEQAAPVADLSAREDASLDVEDPPTIEEPSIPSLVVSPESPLWPQILRIVWGFGALAWFALVMERLHNFRRLLRFARPAPAALQERTRRLAQSLGLKYCPRVRLLPGRISPMLWAIGGPPRLLVPVGLLGVLSDEQLDTLLAHELAHLRRRDHWVRVLEFVVMGLYWWHPVVWYARRELREADEQCCDAWVVSTLPNTGRTYASALLDTLDFLSTARAAVPPLASGLGQIADLKRRLTMIMQGNTPRSLTWPGCLAVVTLGLTILPMLPSLHGEPPRKEEPREQIQEAEKEIEKAEEALKRQKDELNQKVKDLIKAQQRLADESDRKAKSLLLLQDKELQKRQAEKNAAYRIEIILSVDESVNPKEIVAKIRKALPEELRNKVVLRPVLGMQQFRIHIDPPGVLVAPTSPPRPPAPPQTATLPQPTAGQPDYSRPPVPPGRPNVPLSKSSEKRINDLEKKLEKVLRELQELRQQMKQPRSGNYPRPEPGATGYSPPVAPIPYPHGTVALSAPTPPALPPHNPNPAPTPNVPSRDNPYYAPTVPLAPSVERGR
jgi:beta-lactamase regulating signal transducer with metallopeptidase domain